MALKANQLPNITSATAPGKIMLIGEHTVVYGKPAIVASINRAITVTLTRTNRPTKKNELTPIIDAIEYEAKKILRRKTLPSYSITIDTSLPIGVGLGSSAALCVAFTKSLLLLLDKKVNIKTLYRIALAGEKVAHGGNASGADVAAVLHEGLLSFRKTSKRTTVKPLSIELTEQLKRFLVIDSGPPAESTKQIVAYVASKITNKRVRKVLHIQAKLAVALLKALNDNDATEILQIIKHAQKNLAALRVVSKKAKEIVQAVELAGGAAKITGAGGRKNGSGMLLAYHPDPNVLTHLAKENNWNLLPIRIGK